VAERNEIDEVVRMEVADKHRRQVPRFGGEGELGERALTEVEDDGGSIVGDEVGRTEGARAVGVRRPGAEDRQLHRRWGAWCACMVASLADGTVDRSGP